MSLPLIPEDLAELFEGGVSILVGTRDASLRPEVTRGVGAVVHPDRARVTVFLPISVAGRALANLRDNGRISVGFSSVLEGKALQLKGQLETLRECREDELAVITRYHAAYSEILHFMGVSRALTRRWNVWPSMAITFVATDLFSQTPGPNAGARLAGAGA